MKPAQRIELEVNNSSNNNHIFKRSKKKITRLLLSTKVGEKRGVKALYKAQVKSIQHLTGARHLTVVLAQWHEA